jgi:type IV secretory pathway VirB2 component (pilin)
MKKKKLYSVLSAATSLVGIGMLLGYSLANGTSKTPLWVGGILILLGAVTFGMTISSRDVTERIEKSNK